MDHRDIILVGVNGSVVAFRRDTGTRVWAVHLKSSGFVSVMADEERVYAHTAGEVFCLQLATGDALWHDRLSGFGYGLASIALPGQPAAPVSPFEQRRAEESTPPSVETNS